MLLYSSLENEIDLTRPLVTNEFDFMRYVDIHRSQVGETSEELVKMIKNQFYGSNEWAGEKNLEKIWSFIEPKIQKNTGLAEFILDYGGAKSKFFFPWLVNVFRSPATALEMSYGSGPDVAGVWHEDILDSYPSDPFIPFIYDDPAFVYNREREVYIANLASNAEEIAWSDARKAKIVDFGAGRLAWYRHYGSSLSLSASEVYAFDKDPSIDPDTLFDGELENNNIHYKHGDFKAQLTNPDCREADLVILGGVASYIPPDDFAEKVIPAISNLLVAKGCFFFDMQTETPCYRHSMDILDWPEIILPDVPSKIIDYVEGIRKTLWSNGLKFSADYIVDTYNKIPSAVMITMQKV